MLHIGVAYPQLVINRDDIPTNGDEMTNLQPLYKTTDARRLALTYLTINAEKGHPIPVDKGTVTRMSRLSANVLGQYAARPEHYRTARLVDAGTRHVTLKVGGAY